MKKSHLIIGLSIFAAALAVVIVSSRQSSYTMRTREISKETAIKAMPYIIISEEESSFVQSLLQNDYVKSALESGAGLSIEKGKELAFGELPENIIVSECSVSINDDAIYFGYSINNTSVMLTILLDGSIYKSIPVYSGRGDLKTIYENINNELYKKHTLSIF